MGVEGEAKIEEYFVAISIEQGNMELATDGGSMDLEWVFGFGLSYTRVVLVGSGLRTRTRAARKPCSPDHCPIILKPAKLLELS